MRRREFIAALGGAAIAAPLAARAQQQPPTVLRVGAANTIPKEGNPIILAFERRMSELGYEQGRNFAFDYVRVASFAEYGQAYREISARGADIIFASGPEIALISALAVAGPSPVVMVAIDYDPVTRGYVPNLARPAGSITGLFFQQIELTTKRLQLMREALPELKATTIFWDRISADQWHAADGAAASLGLSVFGIEFRTQPYDYEKAFPQVAADHRGWLMVLASPVFAVPNRRALPDFALKHGMPSMFFAREFVDAGGLVSYGPSFTEMGKRAAEYVDRIAKGSKPADLPIEQPTKFELVINLKTAKALGLAIPPALLARADEVIE